MHALGFARMIVMNMTRQLVVVITWSFILGWPALAGPKVPQVRALKARVGELQAATVVAPAQRVAALMALLPAAERECEQNQPGHDVVNQDSGPESKLMSWKIISITYDSSYIGNEWRDPCPGHSYKVESMAHVVLSQVFQTGDGEPEQEELGELWVLVDGQWYLQEFDC
jgi:hypothetical protein